MISGLKEAVETAAVKLKEAGARRVIPLNVSGPFHSYLLEEAGEKLGKFLENIPVSEPVIPYVANVTAAYVTKAQRDPPVKPDHHKPFHHENNPGSVHAEYSC